MEWTMKSLHGSLTNKLNRSYKMTVDILNKDKHLCVFISIDKLKLSFRYQIIFWQFYNFHMLLPKTSVINLSDIYFATRVKDLLNYVSLKTLC